MTLPSISPAPLLTVQDLWKSYDSQVVLERVNLTVQAGEFCSLVGPSGCGKSTFLRILLSQEQQDRGSVHFDSAPLPQEPGPERGVVFQRYSVYPHLTVTENALLGLEFHRSPLFGKLRGPARSHAIEEVTETLKAVNLGHALDKFPHQLSGGMQQRLAIAQTLVLKPKVMLLDEPFGALDPGTRKDIHTLMLDLWQQTGMTIFMVTHDLEEGFKLGTRLLAFDKIRHDPHAPERYGATITLDLPLDEKTKADPSSHYTQQTSEMSYADAV